MNNFKGIIFDLGGVIIEIAQKNTIEAFRKLGVVNPEEIFTIQRQNTVVDHFETGQITDLEFFSLLQKNFKISASYSEMHYSWCAMLKGISQETIEVLRKLKKNYKLFLLSNTNKLHYEAINKSLGFHIENLFDRSFFSFMEGKRKPDIDLFKHVVKETKISPKEMIYIDDLEKNVDAAKRVNLNTILYETNYYLPDFLLQGGFLAA